MQKYLIRLLFILGLSLFLELGIVWAQPAAVSIAIRGAPALPADFDHFPYVNPDAPKGGRLSLAFNGSFDSLNPYNLRAGSTAQGLFGNVFQTLMIRSQNEPFTLYAQIAQRIETDIDRRFVTFYLNPHAHFSNKKPITAKDILFTFELLKSKGRPQHQAAFTNINKVEIIDEQTIRFDLTGLNDRELPLTLALMPVLSSSDTDVKRFEEANLDIPVGSGPYIISEVQPGQRLVLKRDPDYWGKDQAFARGLYNFDEINISYFRDGAAMFEAFRAGTIDFRDETSASHWLNDYNFPDIRERKTLTQTIPIGGPKGLEGLVFNTRRAIFRDSRIREAIAMMFDFEWINAHFFGDLYTRSESFFAESPLASTGHPASAREVQVLAQFPDLVRKDFIDGSWHPPRHTGSGHDDEIAHKALDLLIEAGYSLEGNFLTKDGQKLTFQILCQERSQERVALNFAASLAKIGIETEVRAVDEAQYQRRRQKFDFDMIFNTYTASASPGSEQRGRWGSMSANVEGSYNLAGAHLPAIDALIAQMVATDDQQEFTAIVRAYDRVLLSQFFLIPLYHRSHQWVAFNKGLSHPDVSPAYYFPPFGASLETWWWEEKK